MKKVMFYCQHVLGMGHLMRSSEIVRALAAEGLEVCFLNGGEMVDGIALPDGIRTVCLHPIKSDAEFRDIQTAGDANDLDEIKELRRRAILEEYLRFKPDVLIIELFPFGRRKFKFELMPLLEFIRSTRQSTSVVCSLRDILVSKRDQARYEEQVCETMNRYFDLLLVHADDKFQRIEETFPGFERIETPTRYTGFVVQAPDKNSSRTGSRDGSGPEKRILVSIGGGRVGVELIESSIMASGLIAQPHRMSIFTGPYLPDDDFQRLLELADGAPNLSIDRFTNQFLDHLGESDLSISMAGYNTCMNIITTGTRAMVYPFKGNNNEEQTIRARKLEGLGLVSAIGDQDLAPARMAELITSALALETGPRRTGLDINGAFVTAKIIRDLADRADAGSPSVMGMSR